MQKQARVYISVHRNVVGAESFGFQATARNLQSLVEIHSILIPNQRPLAKDSDFHLPFRYFSQLPAVGDRRDRIWRG